jgi:hypothetical protein
MTSDPGALREAMGSFVHALHQAYLDQARLLPVGEQGALPLVAAGQVTVLAVGVRHLHVIATTDPLPAPRGPEVEVADRIDELSWTLRFFDPVVAPGLGLVDETAGPASDEVRRVLGVGEVVYHLSVSPGGGLTAHHAQHAGTALANQHAAAARDHDALRAAVGSRADAVGVIDELAVAERLGLHRSVRLLARELAPHDPEVATACAGDDDVAVRRALLAALRPSVTR